MRTAQHKFNCFSLTRARFLFAACENLAQAIKMPARTKVIKLCVSDETKFANRAKLTDFSTSRPTYVAHKLHIMLNVIQREKDSVKIWINLNAKTF